MFGAAGAHRSTAADATALFRAPLPHKRAVRAMSAPTPLQSAVGGRCPRCGAKTLFATFLRFADHCGACGLDYGTFNVGDGPAAFLTLILGTILMILALTLELTVHPPFWVHILLWLPIATISIIGSLRIAKGVLIAIEYRNAAREGRITIKPLDRNEP